MPLVNLEVIVTGSDGEPVKNLEKEAFRLFEDGSSLDIEFFDFVDIVRSKPSEEGGIELPSGNSRRAPSPIRLVVFFDDFNPGSSGRYRALAEVRELLVESLPASAEVMLVGFDGSSEVLLPFTDDRKEIA